MAERRYDPQNAYLTSAFERATVDDTVSRMLGGVASQHTTHQELSFGGSGGPCEGCGKPILTSEFRQADNKRWHTTCFNRDVQCAACRRPAIGEVVDALNKHWHRDCWACTHCKTKLVSGYIERNGDPYCSKCGNNPACIRPTTTQAKQAAEKVAQERMAAKQEVYQNIQQGKSACAACGNIITDLTGVEYAGQMYHAQCFVCSSCNRAIGVQEGFSFGASGPVCRGCSQASSGGNFCVLCGKPLQGKYLNGPSGKMHPGCFVCTGCKGSLAGGYVDRGGAPYCPGCASKGAPASALSKGAVGAQHQRGFTIDPRTGQKKYT